MTTYDRVTDGDGNVIDLERFLHEIQSPRDAHALTVDLVGRINALKRGDGGWNGNWVALPDGQTTWRETRQGLF